MARDQHGFGIAISRAIRKPPVQILFASPCDGVKHEIEPSPSIADGVKHGFKLAGSRDIARQENRRRQLLCERLYKRLCFVVEVGDCKLCAGIPEMPGSGPSEA